MRPLSTLLALGLCMGGAPLLRAARPFYLPENPKYTIVDSVRDSIRFTVDKTLKPDAGGHLASISSFVNPQGEIMAWHDFGNLEGPGWAANAVGGAWEIYRWGKFTGDAALERKGLSMLDHVLDGGFVNWKTGFIYGYRLTTTGRFVINYKHNNEWFCPGSMAKIAFQLLTFADDLGRDKRAQRLRNAAVKTAQWIGRHVDPTPNGWFPRRVDIRGRLYRKSPEGGHDPLWQTSADGLFILQLQTALTQQGLADDRKDVERETRVFMQAGGLFGSINQDTYDAHENVAYSVAFRTLLAVSRLLHDPAIRDFAFKKCLAGLDAFKMTSDHHGVATKGLLYMEKSWDTAYLWENAEAALAYFEAAADQPPSASKQRRKYELDGLTILRAIAKHHHGPFGFLTEGVDWNNHVGRQHHIDHAEYGDIQYTEPFLNNQHIAEPTLFYLEHLAVRGTEAGHTIYRDCEGNLLFRR